MNLFRLLGITEYNGKTALCSQVCGWGCVEDKKEEGQESYSDYGYEEGEEEDIYMEEKDITMEEKSTECPFGYSLNYTDHKFGVGHGVNSHTDKTSWMVGHYLGDPANPLITIIDTPGTGDNPENGKSRDCEHGIALAEGVKRIGSINAFMVLIKGTNPRFDSFLEQQINMYVNIFGKEMWDNTIIEFTYWSHDKQSIEKRKLRRKTNVRRHHSTWNRQFQKKFKLEQNIESVFVDPVFDEGLSSDTNEIRINKENTDKLWRLLNFMPYECADTCQAPSGFFAGQPWLLDQAASQNRRNGSNFEITWQIWFAGCDGSGTKSYELKHVNATTNATIGLFKTTVRDDDTVTVDDTNLPGSMKVDDKTGEKFKTIRLKVDSITDEHFGSYFVVNDKGTSLQGRVNKIIDGQWGDWGPWGNCSKPCITGQGSMKKHCKRQ